MSRHSENDLAEDVALVTFSMLEALDGYDETRLPGGYRFHVFEGFPGFCDHAGRAGLELHRVFRSVDCDQWLDIVAGFAADIVKYAVNHGITADALSLQCMAEECRRQAVRQALATRRTLSMEAQS